MEKKAAAAVSHEHFMRIHGKEAAAAVSYDFFHENS
jgi:hypothetical protein